MPILRDTNHFFFYFTYYLSILRFDWEEKLLEKTIKTDIKLDQHMARSEEVIKEIRDHAMLMTTIYTRWGRTTCLGNDSDPVYDGFAGGSSYNHKGAAASMLCLLKDPVWDAGKYNDKVDTNVGYIFGTEYEDGSARSDKLCGQSHHDRDVACVVCEIMQRSSVLIIPEKQNVMQDGLLNM